MGSNMGNDVGNAVEDVTKGAGDAVKDAGNAVGEGVKDVTGAR